MLNYLDTSTGKMIKYENAKKFLKFNLSLLSTVLNFLINSSEKSERFKRQFNFVLIQNSMSELCLLESETFFTNLNCLSKKFKINNATEQIEALDLKKELCSIVFSKDLTDNLSFKFVLSYFTSLFLIKINSNSDLINDLVSDGLLNNFVNKVLSKISQFKVTNVSKNEYEEVKKLVGVFLSKAGLVYNIDKNDAIDKSSLTQNGDKIYLLNEERKVYIETKFKEIKKNDSNDFYVFYMILFENLFEKLYDPNPEIQNSTLKMLKKAFLIPEASLFINEYHIHSQEFTKIKNKEFENELIEAVKTSNRKSITIEQNDDEIIDKFVEYCKIFIRKQKVIKTTLFLVRKSNPR